MKRDGVVFLFCFLLAIILLLLNKLAENYDGAEIKARVSYINYPKGKTPSAPLPGELKLTVSTTGFKLFLAKLKTTEVEVDLSGIAKTNYAVTDDLKPAIAKKLLPDYVLMDIDPDTLYLQFDNKLTKKVPVKYDIPIIFKKQFDRKEPLLGKPDSVTITGPENVVAPITEWPTEKREYENLDKSVQGEVALVKPDHPMVTISPEKVSYVIAVEEYIEKVLEADVLPINLPKAQKINIYPEKVNIVCRVGQSNYDALDAADFEMVADFAGIETKKSKYVPIEIRKQPAFVKNPDYSPKSVEYIIYK